MIGRVNKLINEPSQVVQDSLIGLVSIHSHLKLLRTDHKSYHVVVRSDLDEIKQQQVTLVSGGGSGHEPAHAGYVGSGMLSAAICGPVFTSPDVNTILTTIRACSLPNSPQTENVSSNTGCLLIVKNYTGDRLNFGLAAELARTEGYNVDMVVVGDDCAVVSNEYDTDTFELRRGIAGTCLIHKLVGAFVERNKKCCTLQQVKQFAMNIASQISTIGVALSPCILPGAKSASFNLPKDKMEFGLGIHGEMGVKETDILSANDTVEAMLDYIARDIQKRQRTSRINVDSVCLLVNNLGSTTNLELFIMASHAIKVLEQQWHSKVERVYVGTFMTSLEMTGVSLTLLPIAPLGKAEVLDLLDAPHGSISWSVQSMSKLMDPSISRFSDENLYHDFTCSSDNRHGREMEATGPPVSDKIYKIITAICEAVIKHEQVFTDMDKEIGDGDMGLSFRRGAESVLQALKQETDKKLSLSQVLFTVGNSLGKSMGGSSGVLLSVFFLRMSQVFAQHEADAKAEKDINLWIDALSKGIEAIQQLGGAKAGDKTMLDTLIPSVQFLKENKNEESSILLRGLVQAAKNAAEQTKEMKGRKGRAGYLRERAYGHIDPGAFAVYIIIKSLLMN
jgi:dihydroxyacetone kinase